MSAEGVPFEQWPTYWPDWTKQYEEAAQAAHDLGLFGITDDLVILVSGLIRLAARLQEAEQERDALRLALEGSHMVREGDNEYLIARAEAAEAREAALREALRMIEIYYANLYVEGEINYQAVIVARVALAADPESEEAP